MSQTMYRKFFEAGGQYHDLRGTSAADKNDNFDAVLAGLGVVLAADESVVGLSMYSGEVEGAVQDAPVTITVYAASAANIAAAKTTGNWAVRAIPLTLPLNQFFGLFKRFSLMVSAPADATSDAGVLDGKSVEVD